MNTKQISSNGMGLHESPLMASGIIPLTPTAVVERHSPEFNLALAHEIRNPLTNINLAVDLLQSTKDDNEKGMCMDIIKRSSLRINTLINELLANYQAMEVCLEIKRVDLLLDEVIALVDDRLALKNVLVKKNYSKQDCKILINKPQIVIALINIIVNAIDAMPPQKGELKLSTRSIKGTCVIEIEDNGSGISKKNLKNIFKPYFTEKPNGKGLGLSTALTSLLSNHGRVKVHSVEGEGTRFVLLFENLSSRDETFK